MDIEWAYLMSADVDVLPKYKRRVLDRDAKLLCLDNRPDELGNSKECDGKAIKRGLCANCHYKFRMEKLGTPPSKRSVYENDRIRKGTLRKDRQGQIIKRPPIKAKAS